MASALRTHQQLELLAAYWDLVFFFFVSFLSPACSLSVLYLDLFPSRAAELPLALFIPAWSEERRWPEVGSVKCFADFPSPAVDASFFFFFALFLQTLSSSPPSSSSSPPPRSITRVSDAGLWARSGQVWVRFSTTSAVNSSGSTRCGWAPSPAAPNYRRQWHHRVSGLLAVIMRGPTPGVRAPVRVSGFFSLQNK